MGGWNGGDLGDMVGIVSRAEIVGGRCGGEVMGFLANCLDGGRRLESG